MLAGCSCAAGDPVDPKLNMELGWAVCGFGWLLKRLSVDSSRDNLEAKSTVGEDEAGLEGGAVKLNMLLAVVADFPKLLNPGDADCEVV